MSIQDRFDVLLFDSQSTERALMAEILNQIGCNVTLAFDRNDCIEKLSVYVFNLLIFDHCNTELSISDFVENIESIDMATVIAMMVTLPSKFYEEKYGCSAVDFLIFKPFGYKEVNNLIIEASTISKKLRDVA